MGFGNGKGKRRSLKKIHIDLANLIQDVKIRTGKETFIDASKFVADVFKDNDLINMDTKIILFDNRKRRKRK